ncbi:hypothetical protein Tco_0058058 [Tanacetum coccineum]
MKDAKRSTRSVLTLESLLLKIILKTQQRVLDENLTSKVKSKDQGEAQIERDAEIALKVQAELDEESRLKRSDKTNDERLIQKINKKVAGVHEEKVLEEPDSTKVEVKQEGNKENTRKRPGRRLKMKATKKSRMQKTDFDLKEEEHLKTFMIYFGQRRRNNNYERFKSTTPEGVDLVLWGRFKDNNCGVHTLTLEDGTEIHMLAERKYPLIKETLERTMSLKLIAESASESAYNLLSKELASPKQTALGKDISNPLIVDSLLKTIWLSMHHVIAMKHWLFQSKRLLGRIVGFQKFLQLSAATYTSYYCQFYLVLLMKNAIDSRK